MNLSKILKNKARTTVPVETKEAIINALNQKQIKCKEIAKIFNVKYNTVKTIGKKYKKFGNVQTSARGGKPKMTDEGINIIKTEINKSNNLNLLNLKHKLKETQQIDVSLTTISRCIKKIRVINDCKIFARLKYEKYQHQFQIQDKIISHYNGLSTEFDEIFAVTANNDDIFQSMKPLLDNFYNGYDGSIILIGSCRSDNMHVMYGNSGENGLFPLIINYIYNDLMEKCRKEIIIRVSYMEINKDKIRDLLNHRNEKVSVVFNACTKQSKITNLQRYLCQSEELALHIKEAGFLRRGPKSIQSHFVFRFSMEIIDYQNCDGIMTKSTVSHFDIVDMQPDECPEFFNFIHKAANGEPPNIEDATDCILPVLCKPLLGQCQSIYLFHVQLSSGNETMRILEDTNALRLIKHEVPVRKDHVVFQEAQLSTLSSQMTELYGLLCRPSEFSFPSSPIGHLNMLRSLENDLKALRDESAGELHYTRFNELFDYCRLIKERWLLSSSRLTELERAVATLRETFLSSFPKPRIRTVIPSVPKSSTETVQSSVRKPRPKAIQSSLRKPRKAVVSSIPKPSNSQFRSIGVPSYSTTEVSSDGSLHSTKDDTVISNDPIISTSIPKIISGPFNINPEYQTHIPVIRLLPEPPMVDVDSEPLKCEGRAICTPPTNRVQAKPPPYCIRVVRINNSTD